MHAAAAAPEGGGDRAEPDAGLCDAQAPDGGGAEARKRGELQGARHVRIPDRHGSEECRQRDCLHGGEPAAAGGAHGYRRSDGRRSREDAAQDCRRRDAEGGGAHRDPCPARLRDPASREHGADGRDGRRGADGGRAHHVQSAFRAGHPRRHVRLCRIPHQPELRLAAGEADRAFALARLCRRGGAGAARAQRIPDRGRDDESFVPAGADGAGRCAEERGEHGLHRGTCGRACESRSNAGALFHRRGRRRCPRRCRAR